MQRFKISVVAVSWVLLAVAAVASLPSSGTQAQGRGPSPNDVNVVNTPTVNAQQSGAWSVAVSGTPTVNSQQSGPWSVGLAGTPTVIAQQDGAWAVGVSGLTDRVTTSARVVLLAGDVIQNVSIPTPACPAGTDFLVTGVHAGPEVLIGATSINVVQLQHWAVSVPVFQFHGGGAFQAALTALGNGPEAISASIPAGQRIFGSNVIVSVLILGGGGATQRFEFNVHLTGFCGVGFTQ